MKLYKGLIIILILWFVTSLSGYFHSQRNDMNLVQDHTNYILDNMFSEVESDIKKTGTVISDIESLNITIQQDYFPYAFVNSRGIYDGSYVRILKRLGQIFNFKVYFNQSELNDSKAKRILKGTISVGNEDGIESKPLIQIEKGNNNANTLIEYLDAICISKGMDELESSISSEYDVRYSTVQDYQKERIIIEMIIIIMPLSGLCIFSILKIKSDMMAYYDFLTKLPNRRSFDKRKDTYDIDITTAIYIDLDNLKKVNDTVNHKEGDKLIVGFVKKLEKLYPKKHIYRVGGDEFIILYKGNIELFLTKLKKVFFSSEEESTSNNLSFSAGVVEMRLLNIFSVEEAVNIADHTMYEAKKSGKGDIVRATKQHVEDYRMTNYIKMHIEKTCKERSFIPFFQPFINGETGEIKGFETLVRMKIVDSYVPNNILIKQVRELSLLSIIDLQMFEESMKFARLLLDKQLADEEWVFNSNFSAYTLSRIKIEQLKLITDKYGINPTQVVIEITEDDLLEKSIGDFLSSYKKYGFKIAIDDFGTAYSSFIRLIEIKPDIMKIDRSLLSYNITDDQDIRSVYNSIVHLGRSLNSAITAEGVERIEQIIFLQSLGVETFQGFHFSKPVPKEEFMELVETRQALT